MEKVNVNSKGLTSAQLWNTGGKQQVSCHHIGKISPISLTSYTWVCLIKINLCENSICAGEKCFCSLKVKICLQIRVRIAVGYVGKETGTLAWKHTQNPSMRFAVGVREESWASGDTGGLTGSCPTPKRRRTEGLWERHRLPTDAPTATWEVEI